jgi:hypothetical protein
MDLEQFARYDALIMGFVNCGHQIHQITRSGMGAALV